MPTSSASSRVDGSHLHSGSPISSSFVEIGSEMGTAHLRRSHFPRAAAVTVRGPATAGFSCMWCPPSVGDFNGLPKPTRCHLPYMKFKIAPIKCSERIVSVLVAYVWINGAESFSDHRVVEFARRIPTRLKVRGGVGKWILRRVLERQGPRALFERPKMGSAVPLDRWLWSSKALG